MPAEESGKPVVAREHRIPFLFAHGDGTATCRIRVRTYNLRGTVVDSRTTNCVAIEETGPNVAFSIALWTIRTAAFAIAWVKT
jgi:hypothetical protein